MPRHRSRFASWLAPAFYEGLLLLAGASIAVAQEGTWPAPGEHVAITLHDARQIQGVVTEETTEQRLSLARTIRGITTQSSIPREKIAKIDPRSPLDHAMEDAHSKPRPVRRLPPKAPTAKIEHLEVRARLANWDNDPEPDGLIVEVSPRDREGNFVAAAGGIDLELYGERHRHGGRVFDDREPFPLLDRSSQIVRSSDASGDAYVVQLPFRRFHPDRNLELGPFALVRVRFSTAGQGVFEAADDWTVIRESSRFRDDLQQLTGRRYHAREQTRLQPLVDVRQVSPRR